MASNYCEIVNSPDYKNKRWYIQNKYRLTNIDLKISWQLSYFTIEWHWKGNFSFGVLNSSIFFLLCKSFTKTKMYNLSLNNFLCECISLMDTYKWITNISTPYAYQIGTKRKNGRSKKYTNLCQNISKWSYYMYKCVSFLYFTSHICNKIVFFDMGYIFLLSSCRKMWYNCFRCTVSHFSTTFLVMMTHVC